MKCPACGGDATKTTRTVRLRHGKLEIKIVYCHDIISCGYTNMDYDWLRPAAQEATR